MRLAAALTLATAAFAIGVPFLDRAGVALIGLAFAALALPPRPVSVRRPWPMPSTHAEVADAFEPDDDLDELVTPGGRYTSEGYVTS